jgi:hypothetical protein
MGDDDDEGGCFVNRYRISLLAIAVTITVSACGSSTEPSTAEQIQGSWGWVESSGGITGQTQTPESTGQTMQLRFLASAVAELYRNGALQASTGYSIATVEDGQSEHVVYDESILGFASQSVAFDGIDVLLLTDPCCDGFAYRFERQ